MVERLVSAMYDEIRCTAGQTDYPADCERHSEHYWCKWCAGYFGVPHAFPEGSDTLTCHTGPDPSTQPDKVNCICRYCATYARSGYDAAEALRTERIADPVPVPTRLWHLATCMECEPRFPMPFDDKQKRDAWAVGHTDVHSNVLLHAEERIR